MYLWDPKVLVKIRMLTLRLMIERLWNISKTCWYQFLLSLSLSLSKIMHSWCRMHQVVHQGVFREEKHKHWWRTFRWDSTRSRRQQQQQQQTKFHYKSSRAPCITAPTIVSFGCGLWSPMSWNWTFQTTRNLACLLLLFSFYLVCYRKILPPHKQRTLVIISLSSSSTGGAQVGARRLIGVRLSFKLKTLDLEVVCLGMFEDFKIEVFLALVPFIQSYSTFNNWKSLHEVGHVDLF